VTFVSIHSKRSYPKSSSRQKCQGDHSRSWRIKNRSGLLTAFFSRGNSAFREKAAKEVGIHFQVEESDMTCQEAKSRMEQSSEDIPDLITAFDHLKSCSCGVAFRKKVAEIRMAILFARAKQRSASPPRRR